MLMKMNSVQRYSIIFTIVFIATFIGFFYTQESIFASTLWPAIGFAAAFYTILQKKSLLVILPAIFLATFLARIIFFNESFWMMLFLVSLSTISNLIVILLFNKTLSYTQNKYTMSLRNIILWLSACVIPPLFGALFAISVWYSFYPSMSFLNDFIRWSVGDIFGLLIFSSLVFLSMIFDPTTVSKKDILQSSIYVLFSLVISYFLFFHPEHNMFYQLSYIYFILFFAATFFFTFRTLIGLNAVLVIVFSAYLYTTNESHSYIDVIFEFNMFLFALSTVASIAKIVVYNLKGKNNALESTNKELDTLIQSTNSILQMSKVFINEEDKEDEELLSQMFDIATSIFHNFDYATCYLKRQDHIYFVSAVGYDAKYLNTLKFNPSTFIFDKNHVEVVDQKSYNEQLESEIPDGLSEYLTKFPDVKSSIRFGIFFSDTVVGGMSFDQSVEFDQHFTKYDIESFDSFQKLMNGFYEINYLSTKNDKLKNDLVLSLVRTLELYDHYTGGHSEDVAYLSLEISKRLQLDKQDQFDVYWAGIVHDIGKVGVDVSIINKPGKLTASEFNEVKKHPLHGYNILNRSEDLKRIASWVKSHHEWWNGQGYPEQLSGNEIPLGAQILCISDAVSSMATARSYSPEKSAQKIKDEIILFKGVQFSPNVCDIMIEMIEDGFITEYFESK